MSEPIVHAGDLVVFRRDVYAHHKPTDIPFDTCQKGTVALCIEDYDPSKPMHVLVCDQECYIYSTATRDLLQDCVEVVRTEDELMSAGGNTLLRVNKWKDLIIQTHQITGQVKKLKTRWTVQYAEDVAALRGINQKDKS